MAAKDAPGAQLTLRSELRPLLFLRRAEVGPALKLQLDTALLKKLKDADKKVRAAVGKEITSGKMTQAEAQKKWNRVIFGVPDEVREVLSDEQRKKLDELLGKRFAFNE